MARAPSAAELLANRFCRPQRIGIFGYRGVGKTTLLTVLYREAVGGRLPPFRLAAGDARTAHYLSDKIVQLESGEPLPATLAETDLRFHLYHQTNRLELVFRDYQGEHTELGREEPIGDFLRDCDALWLCFDAARIESAPERLKRQQEVEQLLETYLGRGEGVPSLADHRRDLERPVALLFTKGDLLPAGQSAEALAASHFDLTRYALETHCPSRGWFVVQCLNAQGELAAANLDNPLGWLMTALQEQDEARLAQLWSLAGRNTRLLTRCVGCFTQRYPSATATARFQTRLREARQRRWRRRLVTGATAAVCLVMGFWGYQAVASPYLRGLHREEQRAALVQRIADPDADPEALWQQVRQFKADFPEADLAEELSDRVASRRRDLRLQQEKQAHDVLLAAERQARDLNQQIELTEGFLRDYPGATQEEQVRGRRDAYLTQQEEHLFDRAVSYSAQHPLNFMTRREHYQTYLDRYPRGRFGSEAVSALERIQDEWDRNDFRAVRDHYLAHAADVPELVTRCRAYLAIHPGGRFADSARELLRWSERITSPHEYRVILQEGQFDRKIAHFFSKGPKLSVDLEVNGIRYGPSPIVLNRYDPDWNYEFPRPVRWKLGDTVHIRVTEHSWKSGVVVEMACADGDPFAMKMLAGDVWSGTNRLTFVCPDFRMPVLPSVE